MTQKPADEAAIRMRFALHKILTKTSGKTFVLGQLYKTIQSRLDSPATSAEELRELLSYVQAKCACGRCPDIHAMATQALEKAASTKG